MKKIKILGTVFAVFFFVFASCGKQSDPLPKRPPSNPLNIIVILDISDRVSKQKRPGQAKTDIVIAKGIVNLFADRVLNEIASQERDTWFHHSLAFVVPEQPDTPPIPQDIIEKLKIRPTDKDRSLASAAMIKKMRDELLNTIGELYQFVDKQEKFTGSDIWSWFRASGEEYLKPNRQNYIICFSDGYLDFNNDIQMNRSKKNNKTSYISYRQVAKFRNDSNWKQKFDREGHGLLEIGKDFSTYNVNFLMVEIALRDMLDLDIIKVYWQNWLASMKINHSEFVESQADPQIVIEKIKVFISSTSNQ